MTRTIAWHEFAFTVKRPAYLILTFGMPVIMLLYIGLVAVISVAAGAGAVRSAAGRIGVVDESGLLRHLPAASQPSILAEALAEATGKSKRDPMESIENINRAAQRAEALRGRIDTLPDLDAALSALDNRRVSDVLVIPADYVESGRISHYTPKWRLMSSSTTVPQLSTLLAEALMRRHNLSQLELDRTRSNPTVRIYERQAGGEYAEVNKLQRGLDIGIPVAVVIILLLSLSINAGLLSAGIAEEKENRVLEVLLSSVNPRQLLMGKVLGLGGAALLQLVVWLAMAGVFPLLLMAAMRQQVPFELRGGMFAWGGAFFVLGFIFYGALLVGFGSLGNNLKECQQLGVLVVLLPVMPVLVSIPFILEASDSAFVRIVSFIPFFTPTVMMLRLGVGGVPAGDLIAAVVIMLASTWLAVVVSARLFKVGMLLTGKSFNPIAVVKCFVQMR